MKATLRLLAVGVGILALIAMLQPAPAPAAEDEPDRAVRALLDRQAADWNRRDLDKFMEGYWKSPRLVFQAGGDRTEGWEATRDRYRRRYQGEGREMGTLAFSAIDVEPLGDAAAFARGRWELTMSDGKRLGGLFTVILRKLPEGWRIVHDHTSIRAD